MIYNYYIVCQGTIFSGFSTIQEAERYAGHMLPFQTYRIVRESDNRTIATQLDRR